MKKLILLLIALPLLSHGNMDEYKNDCEQIGFKPKTEDFGSCVLKLRKKNILKNQVTEPANQNVQVGNNEKANQEAVQKANQEAVQKANQEAVQKANQEAVQKAQAEANAHFAAIQRQNADAQRRYEAELSSYRSELAEAEKARASARKKERGIKMIELGLGIASGKYEGRGNSYNAPNIRMPSPPPLNPYSRYRMTFPDGSYMDCDYNSRTSNANCF